MTEGMAAYCGIHCGECDYRRKMNCPGCVGAKGKPFWGECKIAICCMGKGLEHCGKCGEFPCEDLRGFAYDKDQGDDGQRIRNLGEWNAVGFENWAKQRDGN